MRIAEIAERSGLPPKTIRHYEDVGLIRPDRTENGYRCFTDADVHKLTFLAQARSLGFSLGDCRALLDLYEDRRRASGDVKRVAQEHLARLDRKLAELQSMRKVLGTLVERCHGDDRPECPIIDQLASAPGGPRDPGGIRTEGSRLAR